MNIEDKIACLYQRECEKILDGLNAPMDEYVEVPDSYLEDQIDDMAHYNEYKGYL